MRVVYAGLDTASSSCHLVAMDREGSVIADRKFPTSEANLIAAIEPLRGEVHVHLESSELAGWIRGVLQPRVARVLVSHAKTNAWIAKDPLKQDRLDAFKLAELLRMKRVHEVYYPDEDHRRVFKELVQHYDDLTEDQARLKVKIKARLRRQGLIVREKAVYHPEYRYRWLDRMVSPLTRAAVEQLYGVLDQTLAAQKQARDLLFQAAGRYPEIARLSTAPGVGMLSACRYVGYIQTPHRFSSKRKLWRYCRLGITERSSAGKPLRRRQLDRSGVGALKDLSRTCFIAALRTRTDNVLKRTYRKSLERTQNPVHARLTTQRKLVALLRALWKGGTEYRERTG